MGGGGGFSGTSVKCHHYHQGLSERRDSAGTSVKCRHYHQDLSERGEFSRYICRMSRLSSGRMRGGSAGKSVKCRHYHQDLSERGGIRPVHLSSITTIIKAYERGDRPVHLSSIPTIIRAYEMGGGGSAGKFVKCSHYHQDL